VENVIDKSLDEVDRRRTKFIRPTAKENRYYLFQNTWTGPGAKRKSSIFTPGRFPGGKTEGARI